MQSLAYSIILLSAGMGWLPREPVNRPAHYSREPAEFEGAWDSTHNVDSAELFRDLWNSRGQ
jgi:hypothetical protein